MAKVREVVRRLIDDYDGTQIPEGEGERRSFPRGDLDLTPENAKLFDETFQPWIDSLHKPDRRRDLADVRAWARENGWPNLSDRGQVRREILDAYDEAHGTQ